jgi:hypothetical protein
MKYDNETDAILNEEIAYRKLLEESEDKFNTNEQAAGENEMAEKLMSPSDRDVKKEIL